MAKSKLIITTLLIVSFLLSSSFTVINANAASSSDEKASLLNFEWPQFNGDSSFSRYSAGPAPSTPDILWKTNLTNIHSYLAAFNGMVFVSAGSEIIALDPETGQIIWRKTIYMNGTWPVAYKIDETHMIVESTCLDIETGQILWTSTNFCADSGNFNSNVYSPEEKMFYVKTLSFVEAWDFSDTSKPPTLKWTTYTPGAGRVGIGITYGDGKIFPGSFLDQQIAIDAKTGEILWTTNTKTAMIFFGSYADGKYIRGGTDDNTLYCFDADSGEVLWKYNPGTSGYFCSGTATAYGIIYSPNKDGHIYGINITDGSLVWKYKGPGTMLFPGMPTVADGKVYVTSGQDAKYGDEWGLSEFVCLNALTGEPIWKMDIEAYAPRESVAIAYGKLYLIPGDVTESVDSTSGSEYDVEGQVWAVGTSSSAGSWSMFRHDAARSSIGVNGPANLSLIWTFPTEGSVVSSPSVVDGIVYFGSQDKNIYAVNAWSGTLIWKFATESTIESSIAIANGKAVTGGEDGYVYCLDAYNGALQWKTFVNGNLPVTYGSAVMLRSSPAILGETVYIGSLDGNVYAINFNDGSIRWKYQTGGILKASPSIVDGAVYIPSETPEVATLFKIDSQTGELIWRKEILYEHQFTGGTDMIGSPTVAAGIVFASANLRTYYAINATNGNTIWNFTNPEANEFIVSSPIYIDGKVFIVDKFDITCLNASTGKKIWNTFTGDEYYVSPSYADGKIYIVTSERNIFIFDAVTGEKIERYILPSASWSSPTPYGGRLYIGTKDWNLYCFAEYNTAVSQIAIHLDKSQISLGESFMISGIIYPEIANAAVTLSFRHSSGAIANITVNTASDGTFSHIYLPNIVGDWTVTASYQAGQQKITSQDATIKVASAALNLSDYTYVIIFVVILLLIIVAVFWLLRLREKRKTA